MGLFSNILDAFRSEAPKTKSTNECKTELNETQTTNPPMAFSNPKSLAKWIQETVVEVWSIEEDYSLAPNEDVRQSKNITFEQVERLAREESVLRLVGAMLFIKDRFDDKFFLAYFSIAYKLLASYRYSKQIPDTEELNETRAALEDYLNQWGDDTDNGLKTQELYLNRIYHDRADRFAMLQAEIGLRAITHPMQIYELVQDAYCKETTGLSFEELTAVSDEVEKP